MNKYTVINKVTDILMIGILRNNSNIKETIDIVTD